MSKQDADNTKYFLESARQAARQLKDAQLNNQIDTAIERKVDPKAGG